MANYDNKLGEWFKQLDKREKELKAKKQTDEPEVPKAEPAAQSTWQAPAAPVSQVVVHEPVSSAPASTVAQAVETRTVVAETTKIEQPQMGCVETAVEVAAEPVQAKVSTSIFEDTDIPPVEDFLSFLNRTEEAPRVEPDTFDVVETSRHRGIGHLSEGTGEPRPIIPDKLLEEPPVLGIDKCVEEIKEVAEVVPAPEIESIVEEFTVPVSKPKPEPRSARRLESARSLQEKWDRMPHHLQTLFGVSTSEEVAQNSYKAFRESRSELIQRLLDPQISLEEAARVLNVCPTTVRRYTNRGVLKHYRTAGNQRRFRLSDVLTFMETRGRSGQSSEEKAN